MVRAARGALAGGEPKLPAIMWLWHVALPLLALWLLLARPAFDLRWEDHRAHSWLVTGVAAGGVGLAWRINEQARTRYYARLLLVSLAFIVASGFLALHALATPAVLVPTANLGFTLAAPAGLLLASGIAVVSAVEFSQAGAARVVRLLARARLILIVVLAVAGPRGPPPAGRLRRSRPV